MHQLPLHYYLDFLLFAKRGLNEMHYNNLRSLKSEVITIGSNDLGDLPSDFIQEVYVGVQVGDKLDLLSRSDKLNPTSNEGNAFPEVDPTEYVFDQQDESGVKFFDLGDIDLIKGQMVRDRYKILRDEGYIRIDNRSTITEVQLVYLSKPTKISGRSVINPFAEGALLDYLAWQWAEYNPSNRFEPGRKRKEFFNSLRLLKGMLRPFNQKDVKDHHREVAN